MNTKASKTPPRLTWQGVSYSLFKFFASIKLAILVIVSLMVILATGTIIESRHGTDAARLVVYEAWWFSLVLMFLGINVAGAAIDRFPWKKKQIGFVMTHAGIILMLVGSFVTQQFMIDGQMAITEGDTEYRITLPEPILYVYSEKKGRDWIFPIRKRPFVWEGTDTVSTPATLPLDLTVTKFYPKGYLEEEFTQTSEGPGAIKLRIHNSFLDQTLWLVENDPEKGAIPMGPAIFSFTDTALQESPQDLPKSDYLEFQFEKTNVRIPMDKKVKSGAEFKLQGTPYKISIERMLEKAIVVDKQLVENDRPEAGRNPAIELRLTGNGIQERHTVFMNFPDFPTQHGMQASAAGVRIFYRKPNGGSRGETHELRFIAEPRTENRGPKKNFATRSSQLADHGSGLIYQIQDGPKVTTHPVEIGRDIALGWMDLQFQVEKFYPSSGQSREFTPAPNITESENAVSAIEIAVVPLPKVPGSAEIQNNEANEPGTFGRGTRLWLGQGLLETLTIDGAQYHFLYGQRRIPSGFKLTLEDFRIEKYPGTTRPASFESDVILKDDARGIYNETTISMNEPLEHRGYKIYQSGYQQEPGQPDVSIFSVGRDPGIPYKYIGTIVLVSGIITMFFTKKFSTRAGKIT